MTIRSIKSTLCLVALLSAIAPIVYAEATNVTSTASPAWTVDDLLSVEWPDDWNISPDCSRAVWVKTGADKDKNEYVGNLFLTSLTNGHEIQLTRSSDGCYRPRWSPDGQLIAFLSTRSNPKVKGENQGKKQIWLMNPFGGEPWPLTFGDRDIGVFDWSGTNEIIYSAQAEPSAYEQAHKDSQRIIEDEAHEPPVRLFKLDTQSATVTNLTENTDRIQNFWLSPGGTSVVTYHARDLRSTYDMSLKPFVFLTNLKTGERKQIFADDKFNLRWPITWQRDGLGFFAANARSTNPKYSYPGVFELYHYTLATGKIEKVDLDWERGLFSADLQITDAGFIALLAGGVRPSFARYSLKDGKWQREWLTGLHATNLTDLQLGKDGQTLVYGYSASAHPRQSFVATLNGARIESPVQITRLNPQIQAKPLAVAEIVHWSGALGETVEGMLYYPLDYQAGKKYPLVADIHGGPAALIADRRYEGFYDNNLLNARGVFVFRPNYHGSAGYGLKWIESNLNKLNELEVKDIEKGVDYLIGRGLADPDKLAVMGWSNGGTLTAAVTVTTHRYKAAMAGDGPIDWIDYWAKSDVGGWFCGSYFGKTPLDDPATLMRHSPFYQMSKVTTPTLIIFGGEDERVPVDQGWLYYRALQQNGKAPVRFVILPKSSHGPTKPADTRHALEEELAWFDKYLY